MNKVFLLGRLTADPELRQTASNISVTSFTVAVNRRRSAAGDQPEADYFRVTAWRALADNCNKFLAKGRKVAVVGPVMVTTYTANDGTTRASMEVTADDVEFLSPRPEAVQQDTSSPVQPVQQASFQQVDDDDLPF